MSTVSLSRKVSRLADTASWNSTGRPSSSPMMLAISASKPTTPSGVFTPNSGWSYLTPTRRVSPLAAAPPSDDPPSLPAEVPASLPDPPQAARARDAPAKVAVIIRRFLRIWVLSLDAVSYTHLRAHETDSYLVCRLLLEKKKQK